MTFFFDWYYRRLRHIDLDILWPQCKAHTSDLEHARSAFAVHALNDKAWLHLGKPEIVRIIGELT